MLGKVDPSLQTMSREEREIWGDILGRSQMAKNLILDTEPGMLDMMVATTYPGQSGPRLEFDEGIITLARQL